MRVDVVEGVNRYGVNVTVWGVRVEAVDTFEREVLQLRPCADKCLDVRVLDTRRQLFGAETKITELSEVEDGAKQLAEGWVDVPVVTTADIKVEASQVIGGHGVGEGV